MSSRWHGFAWLSMPSLLLSAASASEISLELVPTTSTLPAAPALLLFGQWPPRNTEPLLLSNPSLASIVMPGCRELTPTPPPGVSSTLVITNPSACSASELGPLIKHSMRSAGVVLLSSAESGEVVHLPNWGLNGIQTPDVGGYVVSVGKSWGDRLAALMPSLDAAASLRVTPRVGALTIDEERDEWVVEGHGNYYSLVYPEERFNGRTSAKLTITVTPEFGDPDLFVNVGASADTIPLPVRHAAQYSETSPGDDAMDLEITAEMPALKLMILGADASNFTLLVSDEQSVVPLENGRPKRFESAAGTFRYFSVQVPEHELLRVTVTPLTGDPDLFVSCTTTKPDSTSATWSSRQTGQAASEGSPYEHVVIPERDSHRCSNVALCTFNIAVQAKTASTYSIAGVWGSGFIRLNEGLPQAGEINAEEISTGQGMRNYIYRASGTHADLSFGLSLVYGVAHIYVATDGPASPTHATWTSNTLASASERLDIRHTDANFCAACDYHIAIVPAAPHAQPVAYTLSAASAETMTVLEDGTPMASVAVAADAYEYFKFFVSNELVDLQIILTAFRGNPDLYVSTTTPKPNATSFEYTSQDLEGDIIKIDHRDASLVACHERQTTCVVYVSVLGVHDDAQFSLLVSAYPVSAGFHVDLPTAIAGEYEFTTATFGPTLPQLPLSQYVSYAQPHHACAPLENVNDLSGMIALVDRSPATDECPMPERYFANMVLRLQEANAVAVIMANNVDGPLVYMGAVSGDQATRVTIPSIFVSKDTATVLKQNLANGLHVSLSKPSGRIPLLTPGNPQAGATLHSQFQYYEVWTPPGADAIEISVTPSFGNPDLFISSNELLPSQMYYTWTSETSGSESLRIDAADPKACRSCRYYVGVLGAASSTAYTIQYTLTDTLPTLQAGLPMPAIEVKAGEYRYYRCYIDGHGTSGVTIAITIASGDADLYVSFVNEHPTKQQNQFEAEGRMSCNSVDCGNSIKQGDAIHISASDVSKFCNGPCLAYIGVYGALESTVSLLMTLDDDEAPVPLSDGVSQLAVLTHAGDYDFYTFSVGQSAEAFDVTVTPSSGDPDLYLTSNASFPDRYNWEWRSTGAAGEVVRVTLTDPDACVPCTYRIAVYAWTPNVRYSVTATSVKGTRLLNEGAAAPAKAETGKYRFFRYFVRSMEDIELILTDFSGNPSLFTWFNRNPTANKSLDPNEAVPSNALSSERPSGPETIVLDAGARSDCKLPCTLYAAVRAESNASFSLLITQHPSLAIQLVDGQPQAMTIHTPTGERRFTFDAAEVKDGGVGFSLAAFAGSPKMVVSYARADGRVSLTGDAANPVRIEACTPSCANVRFTVVVSGGQSEFAITAKTARSVQLLQDRTPLRGQAAPGTASLYKVDVPSEAANAVLAITVLQGRLDVVLEGSEYSPYTNLTASSTEPLSLPLVPGAMNRVSIGAPRSQQRPSSFVLLPILSSNSTLVVTDGQPAAVAVSPNSVERFQFLSPAGAAVALTASPSGLTTKASISLVARFESDNHTLTEAKRGNDGEMLFMFLTAPEQAICEVYCLLSIELSASAAANVTLTASTLGAVTQLSLDQPVAGEVVGANEAERMRQYVVLLDPNDDKDDELTLDLQVCSSRPSKAALYMSDKVQPSSAFLVSDAGSPPKPLNVGPSTLRGLSKLFVGVGAVGSIEYVLEARYASTPASSSLLSPGEGSVKMKLHRGDEPHMEISFRSTGATRYELYFGRKESETREQFKYWCGVQKGGSVFKTLTFTQTSKSDVVHTDIFLSERADGTICVAGDENVCLPHGEDLTLVLVATVPRANDRARHVLYQPFDFVYHRGGGGPSAFVILILILLFACLGYAGCWVAKRKMQGDHVGADKETWGAFSGETGTLMRGAAARTSAFAKYCYNAALSGFSWSRSKIRDARSRHVAGTRTRGNESMSAPLTAAASQYAAPAVLPALAPAAADGGTEPLQLVMASPLPPDASFGQATQVASTTSGEMFDEPVVATDVRHAGMD
mmetsp:Transcript_52219/g.113765  ORF Transcript_52219/g.113765 Transcript_52219/m.113765 type:complete len:2005 (+) Transcript_52219:510-6524(+)